VEGDFNRKFERLDAMVAPLPGDDAEVKELLTRLASSKSVLAAKVGERTARDGAAAEADAKIEALLGAPEFETDLSTAQTIAELSSNAGWWAPSFYLYERWVDHPDLAALKQWGSRRAENRQTFERLREKYGAVIGTRRAMSMMNQAIRVTELLGDDGVEQLRAFEAAIDAFRAGAPAAVEADGAKLLERISVAAKKNEFGLILNPDGEVQALRNRLVNVPAVYASVAG
jgi:hypothetical protein